MALAALSSVQLFVVVTLIVIIHSVIGESRKAKCTVCKSIAEKFAEGVKKTAKSNFGGGNTRWEEKSLGSWQFSETRLIEITEMLCSDNDCHNFMEQYEDDVENWWFKRYAKGKDQDFHEYMCVGLTKACCPKNTFGAECSVCPGGTENPCTGNGKCNGEGTREGTGKCECEVGYTGDLCGECSQGYYRDSVNDIPSDCKACHESCDGGCNKEGPAGCNQCKKGWNQDSDGICQDVNECEEDEDNLLCDGNRFCRNTQGSHECEGCDSACEGCTGFGAAKCKECKSHYYQDGEECKECDDACKSGCSGAGPAACDACEDGYTLTEEDICQDVNECDSENPPCGDQQICQNSPGSYSCPGCHEVCNGCTAESKYDCKECAPGYEKNQDNNACDDLDECMGEGKVCKGDHERCANTAGGYDCNCMKGYVRKSGKCERKQKIAVSYSKPACEICTDIVKGIEKGIEKTNKQNFGGGNTQWEEKKLGVYAYSETRFVEVTEDVCSDSDKDCSRMMETNEKFLEQWWFSHFGKQKEMNLLEYFCINRAEACCPNGTYGSSCSECPGGKGNACKGNGECDGQGTREGTGKCKCADEYTGDVCGECAMGHFETKPATSPIVCEACDVSCDESCTEAGSKGCDSCKKGYKESEGEGCIDVDECALDPETCGENKYCLNTVGSHSCESCSSACNGCSGAGNDKCVECSVGYFGEDNNCFECHSACEGCTGPGPKNCVTCGSGWELKDETCTDINECQVSTSPCALDQYCLNNLGSFRCLGCHKACSGCTASGADKCVTCGPGYVHQGDAENPTCADVDECATGNVCILKGEECLNTVGSYRCNCADKYVKKEGKCVKQKDKTSPKTDRKGSKAKQANTGKTNTPASRTKKRGPQAGEKKSKSKKKDLSGDHMKYVTSLCGFALVGYFLRKSWLAQLVFTSTFWIYLYWFSMRFEPLRKHTGLRL